MKKNKKNKQKKNNESLFNKLSGGKKNMEKAEDKKIEYKIQKGFGELFVTDK